MDSLVVAYIMNCYPRNSETFILNEIHRLEKMGARLHVFSYKRDPEEHHSIFKQIKADATYTPEDPSVIEARVDVWLAANLWQYAACHLRLCFRRPWAYLKTLFYAFFGLSLTLENWPYWNLTFLKDFLLKDFLRAGYIALRVLQDGRIQHLHGHFCHRATTMTMLVSSITGIPFSFTAHAKDIYLPKLNPGNLLRVKIENAQFVATCTDANRVYLEQLNQTGTPLYTIYHGVDTDLFTPASRAQHETQPPTILTVGRLVEKKGFGYLVRACRLLLDRGFDFNCRIVGQPDEQTETIQRLIQELGLEERITLQGAVTQAGLKELYASASVFVLPCHIAQNGDRDGIPNVLAEAMAMTLPVVSTNISGIPELVDDRVNGLLVPQKDTLALAEALAELLANPALRRELGQAARRKVCQSFNSGQTTAALNSLFSACLERRRLTTGVGVWEQPLASSLEAAIPHGLVVQALESAGPQKQGETPVLQADHAMKRK